MSGKTLLKIGGNALRTLPMTIVIIGGILGGCNNTPIEESKAPTGTLEKIKNSGVIVLGVRESSIPFSYLDDNQNSIGYSIDLCLKVVEAVKEQLQMPNLEVKMNPVTSQIRIPLIVNGTIDLECGSTTNTKERQQQVAFSVAHYVASVRMAVKANSGIKSLDDLDGKSVVTTAGTTSDRYIKQNKQGKQINFTNVYGKDHAESFLMLESGRAQAFVMDDVLLSGLIAQAKNPQDFAIVGTALSVEPYSLMLRKDDPEFKQVVDNTLKNLMETGEIEQIYSNWFTKPIPPKGINLNLPMSPKLQEVFQQPTDEGV